MKLAGKDITAETEGYRIVFHRDGGYACREFYIPGTSTTCLTRFCNPGAGKHPTCMNFDNLNVNEIFQQAFYGKVNETVEARVAGNTLELKGNLLKNRKVAGEVQFTKTHKFDEEGYTTSVELDLTAIKDISYAGVFWDINDRWPRWMRRSGSDIVPLTTGVGDSFGAGLVRSFSTFSKMGKRPDGSPREVFMEVCGHTEGIRITLLAPGSDSPELASGGMKMWDGPDDDVEGFGVSHNCINLDIVNTSIVRGKYKKPPVLCFSYRVDLIKERRYRLYGNLEKQGL